MTTSIIDVSPPKKIARRPLYRDLVLNDPYCALTIEDWLRPSGDVRRRTPFVRPARVVTDEPRRWIEVLFDPGDVIELRCLPSKQLAANKLPVEFRSHKTYRQHQFHPFVFSGEIEAVVNRLADFNRGTATWWGVWHPKAMLWTNQETLAGVPLNIYASPNPRIASGCSKTSDVLLARNIFADLDNCTVAQALARVGAAGLPTPTMIVVSGHGVHLYWRLLKPIINLAIWKCLQKRVIQVLQSDPDVHDPPRMMRLPGYMNVNGDPALCHIYEADPGRRYDLLEILSDLPPTPGTPKKRPAPAPKDNFSNHTATHDPDRTHILRRAEAYAKCFEPALEGSRNSQLFSRACNLIEKFALSEEEALDLADKLNEKSVDPLDRAEVEEVVGKAYERTQKNGNGRGSFLDQKVRVVKYEEQTGPVISLEDWREQMKSARIASLDQHGQIFFDGSTTGAGKSYADQAAMQVAKKSVTFLPTHNACDDLVKALTEKGFSAAAHPPLNKTTCKKFGTKNDPGPAQLAQKAGLNVGECICPTCEFTKTCEYQQRREAARNADHTIATHARASTSDFQPADGKPVVFIHEDALALLKPMVKIVRSSKKNDTPQARHLRDIVDIAKVAVEIAVTWPDPMMLAFTKKLQATTTELIAELQSNDLIGALEAAAKNGKKVKSLPTVKALPIPHKAERLSGLDYLLHRAMEKSGLQANGKALKLALAYATGELQNLCAVVDESFSKPSQGKKGGEKLLQKALVGVLKVDLPSNTVLWFENASADAKLLSEMTGREVADKTPQGRLAYEVPPIQYADLDITQQTCGKTVRAVVRGLLSKYPAAKKVGIITHQRHVTEIDKLAPFWRSRITMLEYFHSGKDRASNEWLACDLILVLGTPRVPPSAVRDTLILLGRISAASKDGDFVEIMWEGKTSQGKVVRNRGLEYADPSWAEVQRILVKETLRQAIGRGRGVISKGVPVVVVSNEPLGLTLADQPLQLVSDSQDDTLQRAVMLTARNAKYITLAFHADAPFTTGEVTAISQYDARAVRSHLSSLTTHGLLKRKGARKGWLLAEWLLPAVFDHQIVLEGQHGEEGR